MMAESTDVGSLILTSAQRHVVIKDGRPAASMLLMQGAVRSVTDWTFAPRQVVVQDELPLAYLPG